MNIGQRVRYIGTTWPDRKDWEGIVIKGSRGQTEWDTSIGVRFDFLPSAIISCYLSSLELIK